MIVRYPVVSALLVLSALSLVPSSAGAASALRPKELRAPVTAFPATAQLPVDRVETNRSILAQSASTTNEGFMPTWFFSDPPQKLGRISGYAQVAVWSGASVPSVSYLSSLASIYANAASAKHVHDQAVANIRRLRAQFGRIDVTKSFPLIGDRDAVFHMVVHGSGNQFNYYLLAFTRGQLEFEVALAAPIETGQADAAAYLVTFAQNEDAIGRKALQQV